MKNKIIATLLSTVMIIGTLAGCGSSSTSEESADSSIAEETTTEETEETEEAEEAEDEAETYTLEGSSDVTLTLVWAGDATHKEQLESSIKPYIEETGNSVKIVFLGGLSWTEYLTKIQTMIASGQAIDCANVAIEGFDMCVNLGLAQPIDNLIANDADLQALYDEVMSDVDPTIAGFMNYDGLQYGVPFEWNNTCTHINTALLEEAGLEFPAADWDKDTFLAYCEALTKENEDGSKQYAVAVPYEYFGMSGWLYNFGTTFMNEDMTESNLLDPKVVECIQLARDLVHEYGYAPMPGTFADTTAEFMNGNVAMHFAGRWSTGTYVANEFEDVAIQYVPNFYENQVLWGGSGIFTMTGSPNPEEAAGLAVYLSSADFVREYMSTGAIPVLNSIAEETVTSLGVPQNSELYIESASKTKALQAPTQYPEIATLIGNLLTDLYSDPELDVQSALEAADSELNLILSE